MRLQQRGERRSIESLFGDVVGDFDLALGILASVEADDSAIWTPLEPQPDPKTGLSRALATFDGRFISPQQMAFESDADELFFGGAPGGGKSDLVIGLAATRHKASAIFRRQFAQFRGPLGMLSRSRDIIGLRGTQANNTWRDLPGGRAIEFLGCDFEKDVLKYKGRPHDLKAFDELPEFPEMYYRTLIGWTRTATVGQRTRVVSTGNPPQTEDGRWVLRYWAPWLDPTHPNPAKPGELRWFIVDKDGKDQEVPGPTHGTARAPKVFIEGFGMVEPKSRTFVPSYVEDNPYYMATGYAEQLNNLPEPLRTQMRMGDFKASLPDAEWQIMPTAWVLAAQARWTPDGGKDSPLSAVGNDPSRGGQDEFVVAKRYDNWVAPLDVYPAKAAPDGRSGAQLVFKSIGGDTTVPVRIDIGGSAGSSVYDYARDFNIAAIAMNGSMKTKERDKSKKLGFVNRRALWHWRLREALDPESGLELALPPDPQLRADLCAPRWFPTVRGIQVEEKEEIKKRIGRSPDRGEAVIYACALDAPAKHELLFTGALDVSSAEAEIAALSQQLGLGRSAENA